MSSDEDIEVPPHVLALFANPYQRVDPRSVAQNKTMLPRRKAEVTEMNVLSCSAPMLSSSGEVGDERGGGFRLRGVRQPIQRPPLSSATDSASSANAASPSTSGSSKSSPPSSSPSDKRSHHRSQGSTHSLALSSASISVSSARSSGNKSSPLSPRSPSSSSASPSSNSSSSSSMEKREKREKRERKEKEKRERKEHKERERGKRERKDRKQKKRFPEEENPHGGDGDAFEETRKSAESTRNAVQQDDTHTTIRPGTRPAHQRHRRHKSSSSSRRNLISKSTPAHQRCSSSTSPPVKPRLAVSSSVTTKRSASKIDPNADLYKDLECYICHSFVDDNLECNKCHAIFCGDCVRPWVTTYSQCPHCVASISLDDLMHNVRVQRSADRIRVPCDQCGVLVERGSLRDHHETSCPRVSVPCGLEGCSKSLPRELLPAHRASCTSRLVPCPLECGAVVRHGSIDDHRTSCPLQVVACQRGCGLSMPRTALESHRRECPHEPVPCPYAQFGCVWEDRRSECGSHTDTCEFRHSVSHVLTTIDEQQHQIQLLQEQLARLTAAATTSTTTKSTTTATAEDAEPIVTVTLPPPTLTSPATNTTVVAPSPPPS